MSEPRPPADLGGTLVLALLHVALPHRPGA
jgi:hypothetical protein